MINIDAHQIGPLRSQYVAANTPLYIIRTFRSHSLTVSVHLENSATAIVNELKARFSTQPETLDDLVAPIVLICALSLKSDFAALAEAASLDASGYRWFTPVTKALIKMFKPTTVMSLAAPSKASMASSLQSDLAASTFQTVQLGYVP